ncbi:F-box/WD repeat-containing protein 7, partial [Cichlidogyrus casuarinus]
HKRLCSNNDELSLNRKRFLTTFVNNCTHSELVHLSKSITSLLKRDFIAHLPYEISIKIFLYLTPKDLLNCSKNHVITCLEYYEPEKWAITGSDDSTICVWNINDGRLLKRLTGHYGGVWFLALIPPKIPVDSSQSPDQISRFPLLISGSTDRTARIWNLDSHEWPCLFILIGHESTVRCLAVNQALLNKNVNEEQFIQNCCENTHQQKCGDRGKNPSLESFEQLVISGSRDCTLRIWNVRTGLCLSVLYGHRGAIRCVKYHGACIVSGSYDWTIRVWCAWSTQCLHVLSEHTNRVYTLLFDGTRVISASLDTTIRVWILPNCSQEEISSLHVLNGHQSLTSEMVLDSTNNFLISSNADETIRIWNITTGDCVLILSGHHKHDSVITCVQELPKFIVSCSDDGTVKLWDRISGKFIRDIHRLDSAGSGGVFWRCIPSQTSLVCAAGSRNGSEHTKVVVFHFDKDDVNNSTHSVNL